MRSFPRHPLGAVVVVGWFLALHWRRDRVLDPPLLHDVMQVLLVLWTLAALVVVSVAAAESLTLPPRMEVSGGGSTGSKLAWYQDRIAGALPRPWVLTAPSWTYRAAALLWCVWMAALTVRWAPRAWESFMSGAVWRRPSRAAGGDLLEPAEDEGPASP